MKYEKVLCAPSQIWSSSKQTKISLDQNETFKGKVKEGKLSEKGE